MRQNNLKGAAVAIGTLAVVVLVVLVLVATFGKTLRATTSVQSVNITLGNTNVTVDVGTSEQYPYLQAATYCGNASNGSGSFPANAYNVVEGDKDGGGLTFVYNSGAYDGWQGDIINCSITYLASTSSSVVANNFTTGITYFGTFVSILIIAAIGFFVIRLFMNSGGKTGL